MSCTQWPSGRACWQKGHRSKAFLVLSPRALGSIHLIPIPLPCLLSSLIFWLLNPCSTCSHMMILRNESAHVTPIPVSAFTPLVTCHPLQSKSFSPRAITILQFWSVILYQDLSLPLPLCSLHTETHFSWNLLHILRHKENANYSGNEMPLPTC